MVLSLLEERFKLRFHRESSEQPVYALLVAKDGPKLKPATPAADAALTAAADTKPAKGMLNGITFSTVRVPSPDGKGFSMVMNTPAMGNVEELPGPPSLRQWIAPNISAEGLAELLTIAVGGATPVRDMTGLVGRYNVQLELSMAEPLADATNDADIPGALFQAGQQAVKKLGFQLERRKGPMEHIVVDHVEKTPTEN